MNHDLLEEQNATSEISEQLEVETKERLKIKEELEAEKERFSELEKVSEYLFYATKCACSDFMMKHFYQLEVALILFLLTCFCLLESLRSNIRFILTKNLDV